MTPHGTIRRRGALAAGLMLLAATATTPAASAADLPKIDGKIEVIEQKQLDPNTIELLVKSPFVDSLGKRKKIIVVTPTGYATSTRDNWPVIWGLHGGTDDHNSWYKKGGVPARAKTTKAIWVLPETSFCSAYSDWVDGTAKYETYFFDALEPLIKQFYKGKGPAAVFGNSMGGLGSTKFASKKWGGTYHFKAVATFSGNVDPLHHYVNDGSHDEPGWGCGSSDWPRVWGVPGAPGNTWLANDPWTQAGELKKSGAKVWISAGTKQDLIEPGVYLQSVEYDKQVRRQWAPGTLPSGQVTFRPYANRGHDWPHWTQALTDALPTLAKAIGAE